VDSSVVGYDGGPNVRDEEGSVGRKKLVRKRSPEPQKESVWGFRGKTVWDWMDLLIVPLMLVAFGFWVTTRQEMRQQQIEGRRTDQAQHLENQRSQDTALQAYFDGMTNLLIDEQGNQLRKLDPDTEVQSLIQARTETLFAILDKSREVSVVLFLARSDVIPRGDPLVSLAGIDLSFIDLRGIDLSETSLAASNLAHAILTNVNLSDSVLRNANLSGANLSGANLSGANLSDAQGITNEELDQQASSLEGATMPNGQKYEDWLKSKNRAEDG
jgi:uncharacterized protein YjbI with pentapeptide repeats